LTPRTRYNFFIDDDQRDPLRQIKDRDGIPEAEQIRRAITKWLQAKGVEPRTAPRRASTRRKA
jgi:hypothetical protein